MALKALGVTLAVALAGPAAASADTTLTVNTTTDAPLSSAPCTPGGECTLRAALQQASALTGNVTVQVPAGTYDLTVPQSGGVDDGSVGNLVVRDPEDAQRTVTIAGAGDGGGGTIIDGGARASGDGWSTGNGDRVLQIAGDRPAGDLVVHISGVTITGGNIERAGCGPPIGGGILVAGGASVTIDGSTIAQNAAGVNEGFAYGGGIGVAAGNFVCLAPKANLNTPVASSVTVTNSTIAGNYTQGDGGGFAGSGDGTYAFSGDTFSGNLANQYGGGYFGQSIGASISDQPEGQFSVDAAMFLNDTITANVAQGDGEVGGDGGGIALLGSAAFTDAVRTGAAGPAIEASSTVTETSTASPSTETTTSDATQPTPTSTTSTDSTETSTTSNPTQPTETSTTSADSTSTTVTTPATSTTTAFTPSPSTTSTPTETTSTTSADTTTTETTTLPPMPPGPTVSLEHVTINANSAPAGGGDISALDGAVTLQDTIVASGSNSSASGAGTVSPLVVTSANCDFDFGGSIASAGHNLFDNDGTDCNASPSLDLTSPPAGVGLQPLAENGGPTETEALTAGSPAIAAADPATCPTTAVDQRGMPRAALCDVGAYEVAADAAVSGGALPSPATVGAPVTFTFTITDNGPENADHATFTLPIPGNASLQAATVGSGSGTCTGTTTVTCTLGTLTPPGATPALARPALAVNTTVTVVVAPTGGSSLSLSGSVTSLEYDPVPANNSVTVTVPVNAAATSTTPTPTPTPTPAAGIKAVHIEVAPLLPVVKSCTSRRDFVIHIQHAAKLQIVSAVIYVDGHREQVVRRHLAGSVDLRHLPFGTFVVRIVAHTSDGRTLSGKRTYHTCRGHRLPGHEFLKL